MDPTLRTRPDPRSTFMTFWALCFASSVVGAFSRTGWAGDARGHVEKVFGQQLLEYGLHPVAAFEAQVSHLSRGGGTCTDLMSMPFL
jgi:hypothetical protein